MGTDLNADRAEGAVDLAEAEGDVATGRASAAEVDGGGSGDGPYADTVSGSLGSGVAEANPSEPAEAVPVGAPGFVALLLAALSAAAGATHFALTPQHAAEWATEGLLFAITGWLQVSAAAWVLARPRSRAANVGILLVNLAALEAYLWSRTLGLPFGPLKGVIEDIGWIDGLTAGAEGLAVVLAVVRMTQLARARSGAGRGRAVGFGLAAAGLIAGASAAVMASPAGQHAHGEAGDGAAGASESPTARQSIFERGQRQTQLIAATEAAMKYPTVEAAEAAGLRPALTYAPGSGATYIDPKAASGDLSTFDAAKPAGWIFSGNRPKSVVVGTLYLVDSADPPAGFVGSGDSWTQHTNVCVVTDGDGAIDVPLKIDSTVLASQCRAKEGVLYETTPWMLRVWQVPGWQNHNGEFAHEHPDLICLDGRSTLKDPLEGCEGR